MPIVRIDIQQSKSTIYKRALLHGVRNAIVSALGVGSERVFSRIIESPAEHIDSPEGRSDQLTVIEISLLSGRSGELKERLFGEIKRNLSHDPGIEAHDLVIVLHDEPGDCICVTAPPAPTTADFEPDVPEAKE